MNFSLGVSPASQSVLSGNSTSYTVSVGSVNGFNSGVTFGATGVPAGAGASFNPASVTGFGTSTLTVTTLATTPAGASTLAVSGTSGSLAHSGNVTLNVTTNSSNGTLTFEAETLSFTTNGAAAAV